MGKVVILGQYPEMDEFPTVFVFSFPDKYSKSKIIELFEKGLKKAQKVNDEDRIGFGMFAADFVCDKTGATVEYIEPDAEVDIE